VHPRPIRMETSCAEEDATRRKLLALRLLLEAHQREQGEGLAEIDVSPVAGDMLANGVQASDLEALQAEGHVQYIPSSGGEEGNRMASPEVGAEARVRLTGIGLAFARRLQVKPWWQAGSRRLWWRGEWVSRLRDDAVHLRYVLAAFEEEEWPGRVLL
jgi:hypothetical protein